MVAFSRSQIGSPYDGDVELIRSTWARSSFGVLPSRATRISSDGLIFRSSRRRETAVVDTPEFQIQTASSGTVSVRQFVARICSSGSRN